MTNWSGLPKRVRRVLGKRHTYPKDNASPTPIHLQKPNLQTTTLELIKEMTKPPAVTLPSLHPKLGVGHYSLPLQRLHFTYCSHNGDSNGLM